MGGVCDGGWENEIEAAPQSGRMSLNIPIAFPRGQRDKQSFPSTVAQLPIFPRVHSSQGQRCSGKSFLSTKNTKAQPRFTELHLNKPQDLWWSGVSLAVIELKTVS